MLEEPVLFGKSSALVGIITDPPEEEGSNGLPAFILVNAGLVHRVGPNRHYVKIARKLAELGFTVLRFDFSGIGDSESIDEDFASFEEEALSDIQEAMDYLNATRGHERFCLLGLCSGATLSFKAACCDLRVEGAVLLNLVPYTDEMNNFLGSQYFARDYWQNFLSDPRLWLRVITGKANYRLMVAALISLFPSKKKALSETNIVAADFRLLAERGVHLLLVFSGGAPGLKMLDLAFRKEMYELTSSGQWKLDIIHSADHTFTQLQTGEQLVEIVQDWAHAMGTELMRSNRTTPYGKLEEYPVTAGIKVDYP